MDVDIIKELLQQADEMDRLGTDTMKDILECEKDDDLEGGAALASAAAVSFAAASSFRTKAIVMLLGPPK